jgi:hypothetical protein
MNQIGDAQATPRPIVVRLAQVFGIVVAALGLCVALAAAADAVSDKLDWGLTWIVIPIGLAVGLAGLALSWLAQRIWDIVHYLTWL